MDGCQKVAQAPGVFSYASHGGEGSGGKKVPQSGKENFSNRDIFMTMFQESGS